MPPPAAARCAGEVHCVDWRRPGAAVWTSALPARLPLHSLHAWQRGGETVLCAASARAAYVTTAGSEGAGGKLAWQRVPTTDAAPGDRPPRVAGVAPWPMAAPQKAGSGPPRAAVLLSLTGGEPGTMRSAAQPRLVACEASLAADPVEWTSPCSLTGHGRVGALAPCAAVHTHAAWLGTVVACADEGDGTVCVWTRAARGGPASAPHRLGARWPEKGSRAVRCVALASADSTAGGGMKLWCAAASASHAQVWGAVKAA